MTTSQYSTPLARNERLLSWGYYLLVLLLLFPLFLFRDVTPANELRYLSIADEALRDGHFFAFMNHGTAYADKPPFFFWLIMLGKLIFGEHHVWLLSLYAIIPAFVIMYVMDRWTRTELSASYRLSAKLQLITTVMFFAAAIIVRMDMMMCMFIILSIYTFYKLYSNQNSKHNRWLLPLYIFMATFTKGAVGLLAPILVIVAFLAFKKELRTIGKYLGLRTWAVLLGCFALWFLMVWLDGGSSYLNNLVFHQTVDRAVDSFHHKMPVYYYLLTMWQTLAPWSLMLVAAIIIGIKQKLLTTDAEKLFATAILVIFLFLSLISSKIDIYLLPAYPFIIYLSAIMLQKVGWNRWIALALLIPAILFVLALPAYFIAVKSALPQWLQEQNIIIIVSLLCLAISGLTASYLLYAKKSIVKASYPISIGILLSIFIVSWQLSSFNRYVGYKQLSKLAMEHSDSNTAYLSCGISRSENMDVYLGKPVDAVQPEDVLSGKYNNTVLMVSKKLLEQNAELRTFLQDKTTTDAYRFILVKLE